MRQHLRHIHFAPMVLAVRPEMRHPIFYLVYRGRFKKAFHTHESNSNFVTNSGMATNYGHELRANRLHFSLGRVLLSMRELTVQHSITVGGLLLVANCRVAAVRDAPQKRGVTCQCFALGSKWQLSDSGGNG